MMSKVIDFTSRMELPDSPLAIFMPAATKLGEKIINILDEENVHPFVVYISMAAMKNLAIDKLLENINEVPNKNEVLTGVLDYSQHVNDLEIKNIKEKMNA